ncbi:uncharacterized protein LOC144127943 isoform X1 [Amblyomma americanum]
MASSPAENPMQEYALRVKRMEPNLPEPLALARELTSLRTAFTRTRLRLPLQCNETPTRACSLLECLPALNELLWFIGVEVTEVAPGRVAIVHLDGVTVTSRNCGRDSLEYAAIVLHCLLAKHRCVKSAELVLPTARQSTFTLLFCDALRTNESLSCLRLSQCDLGARTTCSVVATICRLLEAQLRDLSLDSLRLVGDVGPALEALGDGLAVTRTLKALKLIDVHVTGTGAAALGSGGVAGIILDALAYNRSITCLALDSWSATQDNAVSLRRLLVGTASCIADLSVSSGRRCHEVSSVFRALLANRSVLRLSLQGFLVTPGDMQSFTKLFTRNRTLQEISFTSCTWDVWEQDDQQGEFAWKKWHVDTLVEVLQKARSLRRLGIDCSLSLGQLRRLLVVARDCASLEDLHFSALHLVGLRPFYVALEETAMVHRVTVGSCTSSALYLSQVAGTQRALLSLGQHCLSCLDAQTLRETCLALASDCGCYLTALQLRSAGCFVDLEAAEALATYLASAVGLRELDMELPRSSRWPHAVVNGLAQNNSIEKLTIKGTFTRTDVGILCDWLTSSRRVHSLELWSSSAIAGLLVETLAEALEDSHTLTFIKVVECSKNKAPWQRVKNLVRRNTGLVQCAAGFALGSELKRAALAYELVAPWHPQLLAAVQCMGSLDRTEAEKRIRDGTDRLHAKFWQLAGIVSEEMVCYKQQPGPRGDGTAHRQVQLDDLGSKVLLHICSFLKVADVLQPDEEDAEALRGKGKRRGEGISKKEKGRRNKKTG